MSAPEKHLEMIQAVVARLASNGYAYKGWAVTVSAGLVAFLTSSHQSLLVAAIYPLLAFWFLDGHALALERAIRRLYNEACLGRLNAYSMSLAGVRKPVRDQFEAMFSLVLLLFYGSSMIFILIMARALRP